MKVYVLDYPRPIGMEPTIYFVKPIVDSESENPFEPEVLEFDSPREARDAIIRFNGSWEYLKNFKAVK